MTEKSTKAKPKKEKSEKAVEAKKPVEEEEVEAVEAAAEEVPILDTKTTGVLGEVVEIVDERVLKKTAKVGIEEELAAEERERIWVPKTELGKRVYSGEINAMQQIVRMSIPIQEVEIIDKLLPNLEEEIINVGRVQRTTDSGRRTRFRVVAAVGNNNGFIGVGSAKGKEAGPTIRKAIERAKLDVKEIKRGCGSWECGCGKPHTVPFKVIGKAGSITVELRPAPRGVGLVSGEIAKSILSLAGIHDVWVATDGHSRTGINFAFAVFNALVNTNYTKVGEKEIKNLNIVSGCVQDVPESKVEVEDGEKQE